MGDHHEENVPQNPNESEKTRFSFTPNSPADSEPVQQQGVTMQTRFGMIPPTLAHTVTRAVRTGQFRFEGSPANNDDLNVYTPKTEPVYSHSEQKTSKTTGIFSIVLFRVLRVTLLLFLLLTLPGAVFYFVFYDSIYPQRTLISNRELSSLPPTTVRFFDLLASGRRFVFLVDTTELMETLTDSSSLFLIKGKLQQSLRDLKEFDSFELLCFHSQITATFGQDISMVLVPADASHLSKASEKIEVMQPMGTGDLKRAILAALALKPDTVFLLCHSTNAEQFNAKVLEEIQAIADKTKLYAVEIADLIKPLHETSLEKLARNLRGDYQWLSIQPKIQANDLTWVQKGKYENMPVPSLTETIDADFEFFDSVSRPESRGRSPFGKEIVTSPNRSSESSQEGNNSLSPPKQLSLDDSVIQEIETDARIVYMSGIIDHSRGPQNPAMLCVGAEDRLALWIQGAKAEVPAAEYLLGLCYKNGVRVKSDENKAFQCQLKAALQGCQPAMFLVAMEYKTQSETDPSDQDAVSYMKYWVEKGAKLGEPLAQYYWANHFTNTPEERFSWLGKAAYQGLPEAQYLLGKCFETGNGIHFDKSVASIWYEKAAKQGYTAAQAAWDKLRADLEAGEN